MTLFKEMENSQAFLKAGIMGFTGSGKTHTASQIAIGLHKTLKARKLRGGDVPVNFLDTETGSDWVKESLFKKMGVPLFAAKTRSFADLVPAIRETEKERGILLIDSITHFWRELTESYAKKRNRTRGLEFQDWAWLKAKWGEFTDAFVNSNCHIAMCGRAGYEYDFFQDDAGKKQLEKTGIKMKAETETGYEPSILILMERHQDITVDPIRVWRTATVLKDRSTMLDGKQFMNPTYDDFKPHVEFLNLGGQQLGVDTERTSEDMIPRQDQSFQFTKQQIEITLDEIQSLLTKHYPSTSQAEKKAKADLLEKFFGSRSWERIKTFSLEELRNGYNSLLLELDGTMTPEGQVAADLQEAASETF